MNTGYDFGDGSFWTYFGNDEQPLLAASWKSGHSAQLSEILILEGEGEIVLEAVQLAVEPSSQERRAKNVDGKVAIHLEPDAEPITLARLPVGLRRLDNVVVPAGYALRARNPERCTIKANGQLWKLACRVVSYESAT